MRKIRDEAAPPRAVVLVEGLSDRRAVEALAGRRGCDLEGEGIAVVPIGGAQAIDRFLRRFSAARAQVRLAGLCDAGEEALFRRALERAGLGSVRSRTEMERLGFYVCHADLEDELIRALGVPEIERVIAAQGELGSFRTLQKQAEWRGRPPAEQLRTVHGQRCHAQDPLCPAAGRDARHPPGAAAARRGARPRPGGRSEPVT